MNGFIIDNQKKIKNVDLKATKQEGREQERIYRVVRKNIRR